VINYNLPKWLTWIFTLIIIEQLLKYFFRIKNLYVKNYGIGLSFFDGFPHIGLIVGLLSVILVVMLVYSCYFTRTIYVAMFLSGAISNIIDRLIFGYVVDYINFYIFIANGADILIFMGCVGLLFQVDKMYQLRENMNYY